MGIVNAVNSSQKKSQWWAFWRWFRKPSTKKRKAGIVHAVNNYILKRPYIVSPGIRANHPLFDFSLVSKTYPGDVRVIRGLNATIHSGTIAIVGPSGEGKTTILNLLGGIDRPNSGGIAYYGDDIDYDNEANLRYYMRRVAWIFQDFHLIDHLSAWRNVAVPMVFGPDKLSWRTAKKVAFDLLRRVGLEDKRHKRPAELSGGEKQRVAIVRALADRFASIILADEPTGNLDNENANYVMGVLKSLAVKVGLDLVMVTHDVGLAKKYCDRIYRCVNGRLELEEPDGNSDGKLVPVAAG